MTDEELAAIEAEWADYRASQAERTSFGSEMVPVAVDLLDHKLAAVFAEVKRLKARLSEAVNTILTPAVQLAEIGAMVGYPDPPLIVETVRAELERSRSECAALTAKVEADNAQNLRVINQLTADNAGLTACLDAVHDVITPKNPDWVPLTERHPEYFPPESPEETARKKGWRQGVDLLTQQIRDALNGSGMPHTPAQGCTCHPTDPSTWTRYGDAVEPGSMWEPDPDCPEHGAHSEILPAQEGRGDAETLGTGSGRGTGVREPHTRPQGSLPVEEGPSLPATEKGTTNDQ